MAWLGLGCAILSLAGVVLQVHGELDGVECPHPGEVKTHIQKDTLYCDRFGRRVNINNKFCRQSVKYESGYGRLIFDEEDGAEDKKMQQSRFPDLCLPGEYYKVYKGTWTCSCQMTAEGIHKFRCTLAEDQLAPQQLIRETVDTSAAVVTMNVSSNNHRRTPPANPPSQDRSGDHPHNETGVLPAARDSYFTFINIVTFCSQFSYWVSTLNCQITKEVTTPPRNRGDGDVSLDLHEFDAYECLPGTFNDRVKCRKCYGPEMYGHCEDLHHPCPPT